VSSNGAGAASAEAAAPAPATVADPSGVAGGSSTALGDGSEITTNYTEVHETFDDMNLREELLRYVEGASFSVRCMCTAGRGDGQQCCTESSIVHCLSGESNVVVVAHGDSRAVQSMLTCFHIHPNCWLRICLHFFL